MRGNSHVRFGGRAEETDPPKGRHRASARSNHTHATLLLKAGVHVKIVSERLGHANVAFTMSVYQHVLPGMQAEAAATFAGLIGRGAIDWNDFVPPSKEASSESEGGQR